MSTRGNLSSSDDSQVPRDEQFQPVGLDDPPGSAITIQEPPTTAGGIVRRIGPALIITASIVGSGELIATTKTGAVAGMSLMWLILVGCLIKVFVQIEFGRHAISHGITTLQALNTIPGPKVRVKWIIWFWVFMSLATIVQLGGIVGGVGQAMALIVPISGDYRAAIELPSESDLRDYEKWLPQIQDADFGLNGVNRRPRGMRAPMPAVVPGAGQPEAGADPGQPGGGPRERLGPPGFPPRNNRRQPLTLDGRRGASLASENLAGALVPAGFVSLVSWPAHWAFQQVEGPRVGQRANDADNPPRDAGGGNQASASRTTSPEAPPVTNEFSSKSPEEQRRLRTKIERTRDRIFEQGKRGSEARTAVASVMRYERELAEFRGAEKPDSAKIEATERQLVEARKYVKRLLLPWTWDDKYWALMVVLITIAILYQGRYMVVQNASTVLVVVFTFVTIGNVVALQTYSDYALGWDDFAKGFGIPQEGNGLFLALATFGIIGVGAAELVAYPYWCIEKGYARFTGPRSEDESWVRRAKGWIRVMKWDAFLSLVIYTVATMAFYLMGATVLHRFGLNPDGRHMISTLAEQYVPVFGRYALPLFVAGAVAVLYSTVIAAVAGHSRTFTDCFKLFGLVRYHDETAHKRSVMGVCIAVPIIGLLVYCIPGANPVTLVLGGAVMQAFMLPLLGFAALYLRFCQTDPRICQGKLWDALLIVSCLGLLASGAGAVWTAIVEWG